jgi:dolichyl-phosphate beta-glucosyltransferase
MQISVIIPCYNEAKQMNTLISKLVEFHKRYPFCEYILVDDGSTDGTKYAYAEARNSVGFQIPFLKFVSYPDNRGKGHAIRQGVEVATHQNILLLDADLSVPIDTILDTFVGKNMKGAILLNGERVQIEKQPIHRIIAGKIYRIIVYLKTGLWMDTQCPFKFFHDMPSSVFDYKTDGFAFDVELILRVKKMGIFIKSIRVPYYNRRDSSVTLNKAIKMFFEVMRLEK